MSIEFPQDFKRQFEGPLDIDMVFSGTSNRTDYLTSSRRYAGQIVSDNETSKAYILNSAKDTWIEIGAGGDSVTSSEVSGTVTKFWQDEISGQSTGEYNQNTFSYIASTSEETISADTTTDTLNIEAGTGISVTTNPSTDTITISNVGGGIGSTIGVQIILNSGESYIMSHSDDSNGYRILQAKEKTCARISGRINNSINFEVSGEYELNNLELSNNNLQLISGFDDGVCYTSGQINTSELTTLNAIYVSGENISDDNVKVLISYDEGNVWKGFAGNPIDSYTKLLLHMDGTGQTFVDSSSEEHTITDNGNVTQTTNQYVFGNKSCYSEDETDYLSIAYSTDWNIGSNNYTIDMWVRISDKSKYKILAAQFSSNTNRWYFMYSNSAGLRFVTGGGTSLSEGDTDGWSINTWYHVAFVKNGSTWTLYKDGTQVGTVSNGTVNTPSTELQILHYPTHTEGCGPAYVDECRFSKGIARWTSNFTPPTRGYGGGWEDTDLDNISVSGTSVSTLNSMTSSILEEEYYNDSGTIDMAFYLNDIDVALSQVDINYDDGQFIWITRGEDKYITETYSINQSKIISYTSGEVNFSVII